MQVAKSRYPVLFQPKKVTPVLFITLSSLLRLRKRMSRIFSSRQRRPPRSVPFSITFRSARRPAERTATSSHRQITGRAADRTDAVHASSPPSSCLLACVGGRVCPAAVAVAVVAAAAAEAAEASNGWVIGRYVGNCTGPEKLGRNEETSARRGTGPVPEYRSGTSYETNLKMTSPSKVEECESQGGY